MIRKLLVAAVSIPLLLSGFDLAVRDYALAVRAALGMAVVAAFLKWGRWMEGRKS